MVSHRKASMPSTFIPIPARDLGHFVFVLFFLMSAATITIFHDFVVLDKPFKMTSFAVTHIEQAFLAHF